MDILDILGSLRPDSTFLSIRGYRAAGSGEEADHTICFHMSYQVALEKSLLLVSTVQPSSEIEAQAKAELIASYSKSLDRAIHDPVEVVADHYERVIGANGSPIKGIKIHRESGDLHLFGLHLRKTVLVPGVHREVKSKPLTVAKDRLRKGLPVERFRQFIVKPGTYREIRVEGMTIQPD